MVLSIFVHLGLSAKKDYGYRWLKKDYGEMEASYTKKNLISTTNVSDKSLE